MATKQTSQFVCSECGYAAPRWLGKCPSCGAFNTMQEELVAPAPAQKQAKALPVPPFRSAAKKPNRFPR